MKEEHRMLCVGGPLAGKYFSSLRGSRFRVITRNDSFNPLWDFNYSTLYDKVENKFVDYKKETIHTPEKDISFWVPEDQTIIQTIEMLLKSYEELEEIKKET